MKRLAARQIAKQRARINRAIDRLQDQRASAIFITEHEYRAELDALEAELSTLETLREGRRAI